MFYSHFEKGTGTQATYSFKIYIKKNFFSLQKRCRYAVPACTVTKKPSLEPMFATCDSFSTKRKTCTNSSKISHCTTHAGIRPSPLLHFRNIPRVTRRPGLPGTVPEWDKMSRISASSIPGQ